MRLFGLKGNPNMVKLFEIIFDKSPDDFLNIHSQKLIANKL